VEYLYMEMTQYRNDIKRLRDAGVSDVSIAWIIYTIRATTLQWEWFRVKQLIEKNPPNFGAVCAIEDAMKEQER